MLVLLFNLFSYILINNFVHLERMKEQFWSMIFFEELLNEKKNIEAKVFNFLTLQTTVNFCQLLSSIFIKHYYFPFHLLFYHPKVQLFWGHRNLLQSSSKFWHYLVKSKPWGLLRQIFVFFAEKLNSNLQCPTRKLHNRYYYHIVHMHHKALTIQTRSLDQRLLAAVITIEIAFGNISNIITFSVTNPIAVFRRAFRLDILLFNQDSYPAYTFGTLHHK